MGTYTCKENLHLNCLFLSTACCFQLLADCQFLFRCIPMAQVEKRLHRRVLQVFPITVNLHNARKLQLFIALAQLECLLYLVHHFGVSVVEWFAEFSVRKGGYEVVQSIMLGVYTTTVQQSRTAPTKQLAHCVNRGAALLTKSSVEIMFVLGVD